MKIVYTHRGFPTIVQADSASAVYESPEVGEVWRARRSQTRPNFSEELLQITVLTAEWIRTGGFFTPALDQSVRVSGGVQSFIAETALFLTKRITRRRVYFNDWVMLLQQDAPVEARYPSFSANEREAIGELSRMTTEHLIQLWVTTLGVDDLSSTLQLYVGDLASNAR